MWTPNSEPLGDAYAMPTSQDTLAKHYFNRGFEELHRVEAAVISRLGARKVIARDINAEFEREMTFGERVSNRVAAFGGSWPFIGLFFLGILGWIGLNSFVLARRGDAFDPYPYIMLNLVLSTLAAFQAPIIMMSQNRQSAKDRRDAAHDYEINLKAELEILSLHEKVDALRTEQWQELVKIQQDQIQMLLKLVSKLDAGAAVGADSGPSNPPTPRVTL